jgi:hypothetical protein
MKEPKAGDLAPLRAAAQNLDGGLYLGQLGHAALM